MTQVLIELEDDAGAVLLGRTQVPINIHRDHLLSLANQPESVQFYYNGQAINETLGDVLEAQNITNHECVIKIRTCQQTPTKESFGCSESFSGHEAPILCMAIDRNLLVTGGGDCTVRFWCMQTRTQKKISKHHAHWVLKICFVEDTIAVGDMNGKIVIYSREGTLLREIDAHRKSITCLEYNKLLVSGGRDNLVKFWRLNGECVFTYSHLAPVTGISVGDVTISVGRDKRVKVFDNFKYVTELDGHSQPINCLDVWGSYVVTGSDDGSVCTWKDLALLRKMFHRREVISVSIAPNGMFFASASFDRSVKIVGLESGSAISTYIHLNSVYRVQCFDDIVVSCSKDKTVKVFRVAQKRVTSTLVCGDEVYCFAYSEGNLVAGCKDKKIYFCR